MIIIYSAVDSYGFEFQAVKAGSLYIVRRNQGEHDARFFPLPDTVTNSAPNAIDRVKRFCEKGF